MIIFYSPHACVIPEPLDPACDAKSAHFAQLLAAHFPNSKLISSAIPRAVLDNNRIAGRNSYSRRQLRHQLSLTSDAKVFEVHTFHPSSRPTWGEVTILYVKGANDRTWISQVASSIREKANLRVSILLGPLVNDVQAEVGSHGVLLELSQKLSDSQVNNIGNALKSLLVST